MGLAGAGRGRQAAALSEAMARASAAYIEASQTPLLFADVELPAGRIGFYPSNYTRSIAIVVFNGCTAAT